MTLNKPLQVFSTFGFITLAALGLQASSALALGVHSAKLGWDAVPETNIQGYKVYIGTVSQQYTQILDAGTINNLTVPNLEFGTTYYFSVKAIGSTGLESLFSQELVVTISPPPLPTAGGITTNSSGQLGLDWTFPVAALGSSPQFVIQASDDLVQWTQVDTVLPSESTGGTSQMLNFSWPITQTASKKFYRLTAQNWMGESTAP